MKKLILLLTASILGIACCQAARNAPATGHVVDDHGRNIEYATVVLLRDGAQAAGMATDGEGRFALKVPAGDYTLSIQYLGYEPLMRKVQVRENHPLGDFTLRPSAQQIVGVVVHARLIRREADRFVVDVANTPAAIGKDGVELLESAPGVWIDGEKISINGKTGTKVYINERELRMETAQMLSYLRGLRAEEIQKIEVIPIAGADQDADTAGGILKITLKKRRENGLEGSLAFNTYQGDIIHKYSPSGNISFHTGRFDLNASAYGSLGSEGLLSNENTRYTGSDKQLRALSDMTMQSLTGGGTLGAVYEIDARNSIGAEFSVYLEDQKSGNDTSTDFMAGTTTRTLSRYNGTEDANGYEATLNYIRRIDTLGSTFKVLGDFAYRTTRIGNDNRSTIFPEAVPVGTDSLYRDNTRSRYTVTALTLALEKNFSARWSLRAGAKHTFNDMRNDALYQYRKGDEWMRNDNQSFTTDYTENISAAYGAVTAKLGRWSLVGGLRGEYTHTTGKGMNQDYFSLFPNANISWSLTKDGAYSLIAQYARTISRPQFWVLTPRRMQISDYTYQTGNPDLAPSYKHDVSMTLVLKHKYTFTGGLTIQSDGIDQTMRTDPANPDLICLTWVNFDTTQNYYASVSLPFQFTKWWSLNVNTTYMRQGQRLDRHTPQVFHNYVFLNTSTTFTLPANIFIDLAYRFQNSVYFGNCWIEPLHFLNAGIKKRFGERFTLAFSANNLLDRAQRIGARGEGFVRLVDVKQPWNNRQFRIGLTYNFKSGKAFKRKSVEAGAAEDKSRL